MRVRRLSIVVATLFTILPIGLHAPYADAGGGRGGASGFRGGGGGGGGFSNRGGNLNQGGGFNGARPSMPNMGNSRPQMPNNPNLGRPALPQAGPQLTRPAQPQNRPAIPNFGAGGVNVGNGSGFKPSVRPTNPGFPSTKPANPNSTLPNLNLPTVLPGTKPPVALPGNKLPNETLPGNKLPNNPNNNRPGSTRPNITLPGTINPNNKLPGDQNPTKPGTLPGIIDKPTTRPSIPDLSNTNRPTNKLPNRPDLTKPAPGTRPNIGEVGDFLGIDKPIRPSKPETLPGTVKPGTGNGNNPGNGNGTVNRPNPNNRPNGNNRPGGGNWNQVGNINIGTINAGNNIVINSRPTWNNIDSNRLQLINNQWQNQIGYVHNWGTLHPDRVGYWHGWANGVRGSWRFYHHNHGWFGHSWWQSHSCHWPGWYYGYYWNRRPWGYWWTAPTYVGLTNWFTWSAPANVWAQPAYYDYGTGGNVVYRDNNVYINNTQIATADEFAQSAAELATVPPPTNEEEAAKAEWMSLGTFAMTTGEKDLEPSRVVQLAVNKEGIISGTMYNTKTDKTDAIQGKVDKDTQRVAFRIGNSEKVILEAGLYNLTQEEVPLLVHFGTERTENWLLVRMETPESEPDPFAE